MPAPDIDRRRLDRWLTLSLAAPLNGVVRANSARRVPVLMYHSIADDADAGVHPYFRTVTTPQVFQQQIELLKREGYTTIGLAAAAALLQQPFDERADSSDRKVVITFDDAFADVHTTALPVLERAGFSATVFVPSAFIGRRFLGGRACMDAVQLRVLVAHGFEIGSHSVSHCKLVELDRKALAGELADSKRQVEDCTGQEVNLFSYPFRFPEANRHFVRTLGELLQSSGYRAGVTTSIGRSCAKDDPLFLPRLPVNDRDDSALLLAKLAGHYDWLRVGQSVSKYCRELLGRRLPQ